MIFKAIHRVTDKVCIRNRSRKSRRGRKAKRKETTCLRDTKQISWTKYMLAHGSRKYSTLRRI